MNRSLLTDLGTLFSRESDAIHYAWPPPSDEAKAESVRLHDIASEIFDRAATVRITRTRIYPEAFRSAGYSAAWYWIYDVHCDGTCDVSCEKSKSHGVGRGLGNARDVAKGIARKVGATTIREDWDGGNRYTIGPRGGLARSA